MGEIPLHWATIRGHQEVVALLLDSGADPNMAPENGNTALHHAARYGNTDVINLLLQANAGINKQNQEGDTFLHILAAKKDAASLVAAEASIARLQSVLLNNLQENMLVVCPVLAHKGMLDIILAYAQAIDWELKNNQGKTIQDIKSENKQR
jgi:ankyrin repeat protein